MKLLSDEPISNEDEDIFGFKPYINMLGRTVVNSKKLPFTIGVVGEYGSGKTSIMQLLCNWLIKNGYKTIWFNPWSFKSSKELQGALIRAVLLKFYMTSENQSVKQTSWRLLKSIGWPTFDTDISAVPGGFASKENIQDIRKTLVIQSLIEPSIQLKIESEFSAVVQEYIGKNGKFIVFIDATNNFPPENIEMVIESLNTFVEKKHCVFVLGLDQNAEGVEIKYTSGGNRELIINKYLKNKIQFPFLLPEVKFNKLQKGIKPYIDETEYTTQIWSVIKYGFRNNPRKVKRFINSFSLLQTLLEQPELGHQLGLDEAVLEEFISKKMSYKNKLFYFAKLILIQNSYPDFYDYLVKNPTGWKKYEQVIYAKRRIKKVELQKAGGSDEELSKEELLKNDPELAEQWWNRSLRLFMKNTSGKDFPNPPSISIMNLIIQIARIFSKSIPDKGKAENKS